MFKRSGEGSDAQPVQALDFWRPGGHSVFDVPLKGAGFSSDLSQSQALKSGLQLLIGLFAARDVFDDGNVVLEFSCCVPGSRSRNIDPDNATVFADITLLERIAVNLSVLEFFSLFQMGVEIVWISDLLEAHFCKLFSGITGDLGKLLI